MKNIQELAKHIREVSNISGVVIEARLWPEGVHVRCSQNGIVLNRLFMWDELEHSYPAAIKAEIDIRVARIQKDIEHKGSQNDN